MKCCACKVSHPEENPTTEAKAAGTGSESAAGTARSEDDARLAELKEDIRTCREEVRALRKELTELRREFMSVQATVEDWGRWYNK